MDNDNCLIKLDLSFNALTATKFVVDLLFKSVWPLITKVRKKLHLHRSEENLKVAEDIFTLSCSQIKKCVLSLFDVFKLEVQHNLILQESRCSTTERLAWCITRLKAIDNALDKMSDIESEEKNHLEDSIFIPPMYFVNWIDQAFEVLSKLSDIISKISTNQLTAETWICDLIDGVTELHVCLDELLLSAVTLSKHCLTSDQHIVKARCQVVLREAKALISELVAGDPDKNIKVTRDSLKLPIKPSNVNVLIDVLKDVLYALETNTNNALLTLLVHCFSNSVNPVDNLNMHFKKKTNGTCNCTKNDGCLLEDCQYVKDFDSYNERLLQIGAFAVSCSSDQSRILTLRSGLASLEALDPHLVPAMMLSQDSPHTNLLIKSWLQEVQEIRDSVFLIVDPAAFSEKVKQMMHQKLLDLMTVNSYDNGLVCSVINIGSVMKDFFTVYNDQEPDALTHHEQLTKLLDDLNKVLIECKIVNNIMSSEQDILYEVKMPVTCKKINYEKLLKRLKLLYTLVIRINNLFHSKDNDDQLFVNEICEEAPIKLNNATHAVKRINCNTYVNSPHKPGNVSRSIFARTADLRSVRKNFIISKLNKELKLKRGEEMNFSIQLEELVDSQSKSVIRPVVDETRVVNKHLAKVRERSILYNYSPKKDRSSLRMAVLTRSYKQPLELANPSTDFIESMISENGELMDESTSLQITEILDQMADFSNMFAVTKHSTTTRTIIPAESCIKNVLNLNVNQNTSTNKHIWNIPVNSSSVTPLDDTETTTSNVSNTSSQPSNFSTLERLNDLNIVQSKLNDLKFLHQETSL